MNGFLGKCLAISISIFVFFLLWLPVGMLMAFIGGYIFLGGLGWGVFCFYVAKKAYKWIIYKTLSMKNTEEIIHTDVLVGSRETNDIYIDSRILKIK